MLETSPFSPVTPESTSSPRTSEFSAGQKPSEQKPNVNQFARRFDLLFDSQFPLPPNQRFEKQFQLLKELESATLELYQQPHFSESDQAEQLASLILQLRQELINQAPTAEKIIEVVAAFSSLSVGDELMSGIEYAATLRKRLHLFRRPGFNDPNSDVWLFITRGYNLRQRMKELILKEV